MKKKIVLSLIFLLSITSAFSYRMINSKEEVKEEVKETTKNNKMVAFTVEGENVDIGFPQKGEGYLGESVTCTNGITGNWNNDTWKLELSNVTKLTNCTINFIEYTPFLYEQILADNPNVSERTDFSTTFTASNNGNTIYKASGQADRDTYYFAGAVTNNYVKFGKNSSNQDLWWRIVRINEDNSVRLIYAGTSATDTSAFISTSQKYNTSVDNSSYVGYMYTASEQYGTGTNSSIKTVVDNWYTSNLSSYSGYISKTAIYCNDRTVASGETWSPTSSFKYAAYTRLITNKTPTFECSNESDSFTVSTTTGNGKLTYPIGLITADEVVYAGGRNGYSNASYYIAQNTSEINTWWTMSPSIMTYIPKGASVFNVVGSYTFSGDSFVGNLVGDSLIDKGESFVDLGFGVRPVISLKACVTATGGNGTASDPYIVGLADGCANVENEILNENTVRVSASTNDASMATVKTPSSVVINRGSSYTFTFNVSDGYEYESVTGCNGIYDTSTNKLIVSNVTSSVTCQVNFRELTLTETILEDNPNVSTRSSFNSIFTTSNNGNTIYKASGQDGKDTYYFAGAVTNNYVKFANKYWRIVRINEDNSVRLIYAGLDATDTAAFISTSQAYNSNWDNSSYVGYMYTLGQQYGTGTNISIKTVLDNWYSSNLNSYSGYISKTAVYCNDRTVGSGYTWKPTGSTFYYAARERLNTNKTPTFACSNANDRFTASATTGNGKLTYPIGLITADEISYAGGLYQTNNSIYYIAQNASSGASYWWTMSPSYWYGCCNASVFRVGGSSNTGYLGHDGVIYTHGVRPVISLKSCVTVASGNGTSNNPYTVSIDSTCSSAEN